MLDNTERNGSSSDAVSPSEFPIGSDESRMAARAALQRIGGPPDIEVSFVAPELRELDTRRATCGEKEWTRDSSETLERFKQRVSDGLPVGGFPKLIVFWPDEKFTNGESQTDAQSAA